MLNFYGGLNLLLVQEFPSTTQSLVKDLARRILHGKVNYFDKGLMISRLR